MTGPLDRARVHEVLERTRRTLRALIVQAAPEDLRWRSSGPRWASRQPLFPLFPGQPVVRRLRPIEGVLGAPPPWCGRSFARVLDAGPEEALHRTTARPTTGVRARGRP